MVHSTGVGCHHGLQVPECNVYVAMQQLTPPGDVTHIVLEVMCLWNEKLECSRHQLSQAFLR